MRRTPPFGRTTVHEDHVSVFGEDPIERIPDRAVIVEVDAAREHDFGLRDQRLDLGLMLRRDELPAVDNRRGKIAVVGARTSSKLPGSSDMRLE
jgi:hypothetical protein